LSSSASSATKLGELLAALADAATEASGLTVSWTIASSAACAEASSVTTPAVARALSCMAWPFTGWPFS